MKKIIILITITILFLNGLGSANLQNHYDSNEEIIEKITFKNEPIISNLSDPVDDIEPYTRISYQGIIEIKKDSNILNLLTSKKSFIVRKNIIDNIPIQDKKMIPDQLPIDKMRNDEPILWITSNEKDMKTDIITGRFKKIFHRCTFLYQ